jgi:hypothetical protein
MAVVAVFFFEFVLQAGENHSAALTSFGEVYTWGRYVAVSHYAQAIIVYIILILLKGGVRRARPWRCEEQEDAVGHRRAQEREHVRQPLFLSLICAC